MKTFVKFYYRGSHSHPVKRTVLIVEETPEIIQGYEIREGNTVRAGTKYSPIKSYRKDKIAKLTQIDKRNKRPQKKLIRMDQNSFIEVGA